MSQEDSLSSPNSRQTRRQEKEELASLNDRFLAYKEKNRTLTEHNSQLQYEIEQVTTRVGREAEEVKRLYEKELTDARRLIDETAKEKARQQLNASKNLARVKELEVELKDLRDELDSVKGRLSFADRNAASCEAQKKSLLTEKADLLRQLKDMEGERDDLRGNVEDLRAALESETLQKVDYQNHVQSLKEEMEFKAKIHDEEVHTIRSKYSYTPYTEAYEPSNVDFALDELREHRDIKIDELRDLFETAYKDKIENLEKESARDSAVISQLRTELYTLNRTLNEKSGDVVKLQEKIDKLEALLESKDAEMNTLRQRHASEKSKLNEDLRNLRASYNEKLREYEELFDLKVSLDQEIATYRALLEEEEARLKLSPTPRKRPPPTTTFSSTEHSSKKSRTEKSSPVVVQPSQTSESSSQVSSSAAGCIQISDVDPEGRFVVVKNLSSAAESVGGFKIVHEVDGGNDLVFKFHQKSKLQGGASVTVWGSEARGAHHGPPHQIIWRNQKTWGAGGRTITKLMNKSSEVVASFTHSCESVDASTASNLSFPRLTEEGGERSYSGSSTTTSSTTTTRRGGTEHVFHQQGDPPQRGQDSCVVS